LSTVALEKSHRVSTRGAVGAALALFTAGGLFWAFLPFFVGLQQHRAGLSATQAGALGSAYLFGVSLVGLVAPWWMARVPGRAVVAFGVLLVWTSLAILGMDLGYLRSVAACVGIGMTFGAFWAIAFRVFGAARNAERLFAVAMAVGYAVLALVTFSVGHLVLPSSGLVGMTIVIGALVGVLSLAAMKLPPSVTTEVTVVESGAGNEKRLMLMCGLAANALFSLAFAAVWAFAERIGSLSGFAEPAVASVLSSSLLFTGLGSVAVVFVGKRVGRWKVLVSMFLLLALCMLLLGHVAEIELFAFAIAGLGFGVGAALPYEMAIVSECDVRGRFVTLIVAMQGLGTALGPIAGGMAFQSFGVTAVGLVGVSALVLSFVLLVAADR
jgi:predicted MFS family arabinose efflux permease